MKHLVTLSPRHLVILALLAAAFLRFWRLDELPPGLYHDEAYYALDALSLLDGQTFPIYYEGWELYAQDAHADRPATPTRFPVFFEGNYGREPIHVYLIALSIKLFGVTSTAIRFVVAASGVLGVWTTYLAAGALFDGNSEELRGTQRAVSREPLAAGKKPPTASRQPPAAFNFRSYLPALAAFALAILYPALTFSRFGIRAMHFVPLETLAVYCFWRGIATRRVGEWASGRGERGESGMLRWYAPGTWNLKPGTIWFAGAGFFLGLGLYSYAAARLLPLLFVTFVPLWFWRERGALRQFGGQVVLMAGVAAATAAPLLLFFARYPYFFIFRTGYVANKGLGTVPGKPWLTWLGNMGRVVRGLFWEGEGHLRHNLPGRPYLDAIQAGFFLLGLGSFLRRGEGARGREGDTATRRGEWVSDRALFLLIWLGVMLLPTILSGDAPHFGRMTGAAPVIAIIIAAGATWLTELIRIAISRFTTQYTNTPITNLPITLLLTLFLLSSFITGYDYFVRYATHPELDEFFYVGDWELGRYAAAQPPDAMLYLTPTQEEMATIFYALEGERGRIHSYYAPGGALPAGQPGSPTVYFLRPGDEATLQQLQSYFPTGQVGEAQTGFVSFHVPAAAPRIQTTHTADYEFGGQIKLVGWTETVGEGQVVVELAWQAAAEMDRSYTAFVHLLDSSGTLVAQTDRLPGGYPTSDWLPGEVVVDWYVVPLTPEMPPGPYTLTTGFYFLPTLEPLGEPLPLGTIE